MPRCARQALPWLPILAVVGIWLVVIYREVPNFYGEFGDDYGVFRGEMATISDWRQAFSGWHVTALYFLLISYIPLKLQLSIPGAVLPDFSHHDIALYRGLIAYTVLCHAVIMIWYAQLVYRLTKRYLVALLATLLLAVNPQFLLMATTPDSRVIGLLFAFPGMMLLLAIGWDMRRMGPATLVSLFVAGCLLTTSYLVHYTALYLIVPFIGSYWIVYLLYSQYRSTVIRGALVFATGVIMPQLLVEGIGLYILHIPDTFTNMSILARANAAMYASDFTYGQKAQQWVTSYVADDSWPVLAFALAGTILVACSAWLGSRYVSVNHGWILLLTVALGIVVPFAAIFVPYRGQAIIQPVLLLMAAIGLTALYDGISAVSRYAAKWLSSGPRWALWLATTGLRAVVCLTWLLVLWTPLQESTRHALPRRAALGWALEHAPQPIVFPLWAGNLVGQEFFDQHGIGISPAQVLDMNPSIYTWDCSYPNCAHLPDRGRFLRVESVTADSSLQASDGLRDPSRVLDGGMSHDGITDWVSGLGESDHWLELRFEEPYPLEELVIANRRQSIRIDTLDIYGLVDDAWTRLYRGARLSGSPVIHAHWPQITVSGIRVEIAASVFEGQKSSQAQIDELYFPGYRALLGPSGERPSLEPLHILAVDADSTRRDTWSRWSPEHVFQYQMPRADGYSAWMSESRVGPHYLQIQFAKPYPLDNLQVINTLQSQLVNAYATRIDEMQVWLYSDGAWNRVWEGRDLGAQVVVRAKWPSMLASSAAIVVQKSLLHGRPVDHTLVQEVVFPGYFAVFDWPSK